MKQTMNKGNPWLEMAENSKRRIEENTDRNLYWITDLQGNYGFYIQTVNPFADTEWKINLKGIKTLKRNSQEGHGDLFLTLNNTEDWQIFKVLCGDLIGEALRSDSDEKMINAVEVRLLRWQKLLKQELSRDLSVEVQMGLFAELSCLQNIISQKIGINQAIKSWVGPDLDKQDFLLERSAVEVKSYRTSKGPIVIISSAQQLSSDKEYLFLIAFGLTQTENGATIADIADEIKKSLNISDDILESFENKVAQYGFIPELIKDPLIKFSVDKIRVCEVTEEFPKIDSKDVRSEIISVKYSIDLSQCSAFEVEVNTMIF